MRSVASLACCLVFLSTAAADDLEATVSWAVVGEDGTLTHEVRSPYQAGLTKIRLLLPQGRLPEQRFPVVYVLPVEKADESRYGDGLREVLKHDLANKHRAIFVAPTFSHLPWYADHPTNAEIRQESYFLKVVLPFVEKTYPAEATREGRLLLGFSKSGWGAWSLLLRHPDVFGKAGAWDAPLAMEQLGNYGTSEIFATQANFEEYRITPLLLKRRDELLRGPHLILMGHGNFQKETDSVHQLLKREGIPHEYRDGPTRKHDWHSGWVSEAVGLLLPK